MYTTSLSTVISSISLDHHLYAGDTQLFFSFHPLNFDSSITHLQYAFQPISFWMTASANLSTLNSSKTELFLIGLEDQLTETSLNTHSARNLGFIFDEHVPFLTKLHTIRYDTVYLRSKADEMSSLV